MKKLIAMLGTGLLLCYPVDAQTSPDEKPAATAAKPATQAWEAAEVMNLNARIVSLHQEGKYDEALPLAEKVLEMRERTLKADDQRIADSLANLAALRSGKKEYGKAQELYQRALLLYEATAGPDSPPVVGVLNQLTVVWYRKRDFDKAEAAAQRLVGIAERQHGPESIETARALIGRAELERLQGHDKAAREVYARVLNIAEKSPPAAVPVMITQSLANYLGIVYASGDSNPLVERINKLLISIGAASLERATRTEQGGVLNGKAVYKTQPSYPVAAKQSREQGTVLVKVTVDETGRVIEAIPLNGPLLLRGASVIAAKKWRFTPTLLDGVPVRVTGTITFSFALQ
ncbi:MAG: TonB family protein [Pyrinomonadaceae bacterium]|nr:TonB family protein [Pyrinomonadaceae bacterium]